MPCLEAWSSSFFIGECSLSVYDDVSEVVWFVGVMTLREGFEGSLLGRRFLEEPLPVGLSLDFLTRRQ